MNRIFYATEPCWKFWNPNSGFFGGLVVGGLLYGVIVYGFFFYWFVVR